MARTYAGILGLVALLTSLILGIYHGEAANAVLFSAWLSLATFSAGGYVIGSIAATVVRESVQSDILAKVGTERTPEKPAVASTP